MEGILKSYYTIEAGALVALPVAVLDGIPLRLNILLNAESNLNPGLYKRINEIGNDFIVSVAGGLVQDEKVLERVLPAIYLLVAFSPSAQGRQVVPLFMFSSQPVNAQRLEAYFQEQGVEGMRFPVFDAAGPSRQTSQGCALMLWDKLPPAGELFSNGIAAGQEISIVGTRAGQPGQTIVGQLIERLQEENKTSSIKDEIHRYASADEYRSEIELWKKRTLLYQDFLSLSKQVQQKEYYDVINWYHKEYEVLPLWFKRLGHIVKVLTGKRKFSSLFGDRLKKKQPQEKEQKNGN